PVYTGKLRPQNTNCQTKPGTQSTNSACSRFDIPSLWAKRGNPEFFDWIAASQTPRNDRENNGFHVFSIEKNPLYGGFSWFAAGHCRQKGRRIRSLSFFVSVFIVKVRMPPCFRRRRISETGYSPLPKILKDGPLRFQGPSLIRFL
ncbi:MAG: hypothetical protein KBD19_01105, partial [Candidatus Moranbacteria bacterium]|nr:hypothetical protein [Candidatus Moranbacteria bacterium]